MIAGTSRESSPKNKPDDPEVNSGRNIRKIQLERVKIKSKIGHLKHFYFFPGMDFLKNSEYSAQEKWF